MTGETSFPETLHRAIELAGRAPSIHNSQPWQFDLQADRIDLYANYDRWLPATDADRRDIIVSCGATLHHLRLALAAARIGTVTHRIPTLAGPDLLASVQLATDARTAEDPALVSAIESRRTDRRPFKRWPVTDDFLRTLSDRAAAEGPSSGLSRTRDREMRWLPRSPRRRTPRPTSAAMPTNSQRGPREPEPARASRRAISYELRQQVLKLLDTFLPER